MSFTLHVENLRSAFGSWVCRMIWRRAPKRWTSLLRNLVGFEFKLLVTFNLPLIECQLRKLMGACGNAWPVALVSKIVEGIQDAMGWPKGQ